MAKDDVEDVEAPQAAAAAPSSSSHWVTASFLRGIGAAIRTFPGYVSRKIVEMPGHDDVDETASEGGSSRVLLALLKFSGASTEVAFANMTRWIESAELAAWQKKARALGMEFDGYQTTGAAAARVDVTAPGTTKAGARSAAARASQKPPPKWKMVLLIEVWVFVLVALHGVAGTGVALHAAFHNEPFTLFVLLSVVVPVMTYAALPLTLGVACISVWAHRRARLADRDRATFWGDVVAVLEDGFGLFAPDASTDRERAALKRRVVALERRLDLVARRELDASPLDSVRRAHAVPGLPHGGESHGVDANDDDAQHEARDETTSVAEAFDDAGDDEEGGVAVAARHVVRWGARAEFEAWTGEITDAMRDHAGGGFLGADFFRYRPPDEAGFDSRGDDDDVDDGAGGGRDDLHYVALFRFATVAQLTDWLESDKRAELLIKLEPLVDATTAYRAVGAKLRVLADPVPSFDRSQRAQRNFFGELLFAEVADATLHAPRPPAIYKATLLTIFGLFLVAWVIGAHLGERMDTAFASPLLSTLVQTFITVLGNVYVGAPFMTFFFAHWLTQHPSSGGGGGGGGPLATSAKRADDAAADKLTKAAADASASKSSKTSSQVVVADEVVKPNPLLHFLVVGTTSTPLRLALLLGYFGILILVAALKR